MTGLDKSTAAVNLAKLAREIAQDILPLETVLTLNHVSELDWERIQSDPRFDSMLRSMMEDWNGAANTPTRVKVKAASAVEALLERMFADCLDGGIPLAQRNEAFRQLCRLGELEGSRDLVGGSAGDRVSITINLGQDKPVTVIEAIPVIDVAPVSN
jgi:hypothetical protein